MTRPAIRSAAMCAVLASALFLFGRFLLSNAFSESLLVDDAQNAVCAYSLATGEGYGTGYPQRTPFDVRITTGPVVLLPAALLMRLTGGAYFAPMLAPLLLNLSLLGLLLGGILWFGRTARVWTSPLLAIFLLIILSLRSYEGGATPYSAWFTLLGEVPGTLLLACGALLLLQAESEGAFFAGAILAGAAPLAKLVYALPAALIVLYAVAPRLTTRRSLLAAGAALAPAGAWELFKLFSLGGAQYLANGRDRLAFVRWNLQGPATGAPAAGQIFSPISSRLLPAVNTLFGGPWWGLACATIAIVVLALLLADRRAAGEAALWRRLSLAFFISTVVTLSSWLGVATMSWTRYALAAQLSFLIAVSVGVAAIRHPWLRLVIAASWLWACGAQARHALSTLAHPRARPVARLEALLETSAFLRPLAADPRTQVGGASSSANWDLQYTMGALDRFTDLNLPAQPGRPRILVHSELWNFDHDPALTNLAARCETHLLWDRPPFRVSRCE